mmetsp:Transcript_58938/g.144170  ORF Transcript_58938/g.144170 Transcript_58938/m.144170 type:complete len:101 (+) Transcript_58938:495-797(+)
MSRTAVHTGTSALKTATASASSHSSPIAHHHQHRTFHSKQTPNRFTASFTQMKEVCPDAIKTYANCVLDTDQSSPLGVTKHSCSKEFMHVKDCFRKVRGF